MSGPTTIWTCAAFAPVYRCGGWASVRFSQGQISGVAGGDRNITASRTALAGLGAALRDLPPGGSVDIRTTSPELAEFADIFTGLGTQTQAAAPTDDLDLWGQILAASAGRRLTLVRVSLEPTTPTAFANAWAELARDKAKATGAFSSAIPKPNLAKISGLTST